MVICSVTRMYRKEACLTTENNFKTFYNLFQVNQTVIRLCFDVILLHLFWHKYRAVATGGSHPPPNI